MDNLVGKKLLILSGVGTHKRLVTAAKALGIYTVVVDYFNPSSASPAKLISDEYWNESVLDVELIIQRCIQEHIDGVITYGSDITQLPYVQICNALKLPCYGNFDLFRCMSNKQLFKDTCVRYGLNIIKEYSEEDIMNREVDFPVFVKPADCGGSKGQSICYDFNELDKAIWKAQDASPTHNVIVEKYIGNTNSFQVTYFFKDGKGYVIRTADGYKGSIEDQLDRVALCSLSPSIYTDEYMKKVNEQVIIMLQSMGYKDGPVMLQGFYEQGVFRFYDPGLRFPGTEYEEILNAIYGINFAQAMVIFALTGKMPEMDLNNTMVYLNGGSAAILYPTLYEGTIKRITGINSIEQLKYVYAMNVRYNEGDTVMVTNTTKQRFAEIDILADNLNDLRNKICNIQNLIDVYSTSNVSMIYCPFDVNRLGKDE